jgi:hypothetical protein
LEEGDVETGGVGGGVAFGIVARAARHRMTSPPGTA